MIWNPIQCHVLLSHNFHFHLCLQSNLRIISHIPHMSHLILFTYYQITIIYDINQVIIISFINYFSNRRHCAVHTVPDQHIQTTRVLRFSSGNYVFSAANRRGVITSVVWHYNRPFPLPKGHISLVHRHHDLGNRILRVHTRFADER